MHRVLFALGFLWALPTTAIGLVLGLLTFQVPRVHGGALVFDRRGPRGLAWMLVRMHRAAMTVGFVLAANWISRRRIRRLDMVDVLKARE